MRKNLKEAMKGALSDLVMLAPEQISAEQSSEQNQPTNSDGQLTTEDKPSTKTLKPESS
jgi:hypothetical protein